MTVIDGDLKTLKIQNECFTMHKYAQLITTFNIASPYNLSQQYMLQELEALTSDFTMDGSDFTMEGTAPAPELLAKCGWPWAWQSGLLRFRN